MGKTYTKHILHFVLAIVAGLIFSWSLAAFLYGKLIYDVKKAEITFQQALSEILK